MVDIHSHILPGLDDGSRSLDESMAMLELAARCGTTDIVATPHANSEFPYDAATVDRRYREVAEAARDLIRIHLGCDFHISYENVQDALQNPTRYTINHRNYLMVELPDLVMPETARTVLERLRSAGMIPVVTHPERNMVMREKIDSLAQWVQEGSLLQVTGQSLLGRFGAEAERSAQSLMRRNLVHFIASDAHDCDDRPPRLDEAFRYVANRYGEDRAEMLFRTNPAAVLEGIPLEAPAAKRKWFAFWR